MINARGFERQMELVEDARQNGASIVNLATSHEDLADPPVRKMAPTLITGATDVMRVMQEEIFGPVLPIVTYETLDEALAYIIDIRSNAMLASLQLNDRAFPKPGDSGRRRSPIRM